jgi:hypothetical protein
VLFEGYYKIMLSDVHSGYAIQRYEVDPIKKEFKSINYVYVRTSPDGKKSSSESLVAISDEGFKPKSYQYTALLDGKPTTIDASFPKNKVSALIRRGAKKETQSHALPQGTFLSTMLLYMVLQKGLKTGNGYNFNAVAEEDGQIHPGSLRVTKELTYKNHPVFQLDYEFKNIPAMAYVASNGNVLYTKADAQKVETELVTSPSDAKLNFPFAEKTIKKLFGSLPTGQVNFLIQQKASAK